jgi:nitrogen-specific signal transduction histidine kinase
MSEPMLLENHSFKELFEMVTQAIVVTDESLNLIYVNSTGRRFFALSQSEIIRLNLIRLLPTFEKSIKEITHSLNPGDVTHGVFKSDSESILSVHFRVKCTEIANKQAYFFEFEKQSNTSLNTEHMSRLGRFAGDIAHSISNPLAVLQIQCDNFSLLSKKQLTFRAAEVAEKIQKMLHATERIDSYTQNLKDLSKRLMSQNLAEINAFLDECVKDKNNPEDGFGH